MEVDEEETDDMEVDDEDIYGNPTTPTPRSKIIVSAAAQPSSSLAIADSLVSPILSTELSIVPTGAATTHPSPTQPPDVSGQGPNKVTSPVTPTDLSGTANVIPLLPGTPPSSSAANVPLPPGTPPSSSRANIPLPPVPPRAELMTPTEIAALPPPARIPTWVWDDNSCSLDSALLVVLHICQNLPRYVKLCEAESGIPLKTFLRHLQSFGERRLEDLPLDGLTQARDAVRKALEVDTPPLRINYDSGVDQSLLLLIPPPMRKIVIRTMWGCKNESCRATSIHPNINRSTAVGSAYPVKLVKTDFLMYPVAWQRDSDAQSVVNKIVSTLYSLF